MNKLFKKFILNRKKYKTIDKIGEITDRYINKFKYIMLAYLLISSILITLNINVTDYLILQILYDPLVILIFLEIYVIFPLILLILIYIAIIETCYKIIKIIEYINNNNNNKSNE